MGMCKLECFTSLARRLALRQIIEREKRTMLNISALEPNENREVLQ